MIYFYKEKDVCIFWDLCILATYEALMNNFNKTIARMENDFVIFKVLTSLMLYLLFLCKSWEGGSGVSNTSRSHPISLKKGRFLPKAFGFEGV